MEVDVKNIFKYVYIFYTKHKGKLHTDSEWSAAIEESKIIYQQYKSELAKEMILSIVKQLDKELKEE